MTHFRRSSVDSDEASVFLNPERVPSVKESRRGGLLEVAARYVR